MSTKNKSQKDTQSAVTQDSTHEVTLADIYRQQQQILGTIHLLMTKVSGGY